MCRQVRANRARNIPNLSPTPPPQAIRASTMARSQSAKAPSQRQLKVGEMIRHALADIFQRSEILAEVLSRHSLTVPEVRMSPDLKLATVYVLPLGGGEPEEAVDHLDNHKRF